MVSLPDDAEMHRTMPMSSYKPGTGESSLS